MRVCLILEGSYPYVFGGVSSWTHGLIGESPEVEFVLWCICACKADKGHYVYELPGNVVAVNEVALDEALAASPSGDTSTALDEGERVALRELVACGSPDWVALRGLALRFRGRVGDVLASEDFTNMFADFCRRSYPHVPFAEAYYNARSMALPILALLAEEPPEADLYHAISTGYAGLLGTVATLVTGRPLALTEHGIYSREREEEIIRADWVRPYFKRQWIRFYYMLSTACYGNAVAITSLFQGARDTQVSLGAEPSKCFVIPNGIDYDRFAKVPAKEPDGCVDIGAPIRIAPIKDVKTLIRAFFELSLRREDVRLHILGGVDDEEYAAECHALVRELGVERLEFTGRVNMAEYMATLDLTVLSSISEGQPLSVLESLAAARPCVTTDVGCCRELLEGVGDDKGRAGIVVAPMDYEGMADALERLCDDTGLRRRMGVTGRERVSRLYRREDMLASYHMLWRRLAGEDE